jgi:metal-responsive CopG/Arc/MetJ family transcriptional regulator
VLPISETPMKKKRSHARAPGQTTITVSLPKEVYDYVCARARAENRSRSNWIVTRLREEIERHKTE